MSRRRENPKYTKIYDHDIEKIGMLRNNTRHHIIEQHKAYYRTHTKQHKVIQIVEVTKHKRH